MLARDIVTKKLQLHKAGGDPVQQHTGGTKPDSSLVPDDADGALPSFDPSALQP